MYQNIKAFRQSVFYNCYFFNIFFIVKPDMVRRFLRHALYLRIYTVAGLPEIFDAWVIPFFVRFTIFRCRTIGDFVSKIESLHAR